MTITALDALVRGPSSSTGTLVLHGAGGSPELNFPFLDDLARGGRVVAPYYPGTGPSPRSSDDLQVDELADRAVAAADAGGLERFDVLGYSLGAAVAVRVATRHADRIDRLVLTAGLARASTSLRLACGVWLALLDGDAPTLGRFLLWASSSERGWDHRSDDPDETALAIAAASPAGSAEQADLVRRVDVRADLVHSTELATGIPGARVVEIDGGHDVAGESAQAWWHAVAEHLRLDGGDRTCA